LYEFPIYPMRATCLAHLILLDLVIWIVSADAYKLLRSPLRSLLQPPATSFLLGPHILLSTLFSNTLNRFKCYTQITSFK
jgi:hypothetical protein